MRQFSTAKDGRRGWRLTLDAFQQSIADVPDWARAVSLVNPGDAQRVQAARFAEVTRILTLPLDARLVAIAMIVAAAPDCKQLKCCITRRPRKEEEGERHLLKHLKFWHNLPRPQSESTMHSICTHSILAFPV